MIHFKWLMDTFSGLFGCGSHLGTLLLRCSSLLVSPKKGADTLIWSQIFAVAT